MFLVEHYYGNRAAAPLRLTSPRSGTGKLTFYLDYSSPWSYLAAMQLEKFLLSLHPMKINIEYVPTHQGALFREIETPMVGRMLKLLHLLLALILGNSTRTQTSVFDDRHTRLGQLSWHNIAVAFNISNTYSTATKSDYC